jgi:hypothetical protein
LSTLVASTVMQDFQRRGQGEERTVSSDATLSALAFENAGCNNDLPIAARAKQE